MWKLDVIGEIYLYPSQNDISYNSLYLSNLPNASGSKTLYNKTIKHKMHKNIKWIKNTLNSGAVHQNKLNQTNVSQNLDLTCEICDNVLSSALSKSRLLYEITIICTNIGVPFRSNIFTPSQIF